jgi:predicted O-methyltransferase YrrM
MLKFAEHETELNEFANAQMSLIELNMRMGGGADIDLLYSLVSYSKPRRALETGVAHGWSSLAILAAGKFQDFRLYSVDMPYINSPKEHLVGHLVPDNLKSKWHLLRYPDSLGVRIAILRMKKVDFFHYDSDKTYRGKFKTLNRVYKVLSFQGIMLVDDVADNSAFLDFCKLNSINPIIISFGNKKVGAVQKLEIFKQ